MPWYIGIAETSFLTCKKFHYMFQMDGVTVFYHTTYFIDLINHGALVLPNLDIPIREMFVHPDNAYHFYVPGSAQATVSLVGQYW